jgi:O-antigen/teichoic acid export membrane protein
LIGLFLGTLSVGYYSPAYTLGSCIAILATPLIFLLPATLSSHYDNNQLDEVKNYLKHSLKYFMALAIPASFGISILSKKLLSLFSTQEIANNSYYLVPLIALSSVFYGAYVIMAQIIALKNKTYIVGIIWTSSAIINTCLNFIFIPMLGIFGAAIATLLAYFIIFIFIWIYSFKEIKFEIDWKFILKSFLASLLMSFGVLALNPAGMLKTLVTIATGAIIYFIFMFLLRAFDKNEYVFLTSFFS